MSTAAAGGSGPSAVRRSASVPCISSMAMAGTPVDLGGAEHEHAVLVIDRGGEAALALEALPLALVAQALLEHLQRDVASALDLLGFVDEAHAAAAEHPAHPIAAELGARGQGSGSPRSRAGRRHRAPRRWSGARRGPCSRKPPARAASWSCSSRATSSASRGSRARSTSRAAARSAALWPSIRSSSPVAACHRSGSQAVITSLLPGTAEAAGRTRHGHGGAGGVSRRARRGAVSRAGTRAPSPSRAAPSVR